jgi:hypothetical protein
MTRRRALVLTALMIAILFAGTTHDRSVRSGERVRTYVGIPDSLRLDSTTVVHAFLRLTPLGSSEADVARSLGAAGIGRDEGTRYYPPDAEGRAVVRIGSLSRGFTLVTSEYLVSLTFDNARALRAVTAREAFTGP